MRPASVATRVLIVARALRPVGLGIAPSKSGGEGGDHRLSREGQAGCLE